MIIHNPQESLSIAHNLKKRSVGAIIPGVGAMAIGLIYGRDTTDMIPNTVGYVGLTSTICSAIIYINAVKFEQDLVNQYVEELTRPIDNM